MKKILSLLLFCACLVPGLASAQGSPNISGVIIASASQTGATVNGPDLPNANLKGVHVIINVSAYTSGSYTPHIQGWDVASQSYYDVLVGTAISATGTTVLKVYPNGAQIPNGAATDFIPKQWRVQLVGAATPSMTLSVGLNENY